MKTLSGKALVLTLPIAFALIFTLVLSLMHKPILNEILVALYFLSGVYFAFIFLCLFRNLGLKTFRKLKFKDVPGFSKPEKLAEFSSPGDGIIFLDGGDNLLLGCLVGIVLKILLPIVVTIAVFLISGGIEVVVFISALITYYSFYKAIRFQLLRRRVTKYKFWPSLGYSAFYTLVTIGFLPICLHIYLLLKTLRI